MKVDDQLHQHRKVRAAGLPAMGLWVLAGSWVADSLSDGFLPMTQPWAWAGPDAPELAQRLVDAGLWLPVEHLGEQGWMFHDWQDFQPTKADVIARRVIERERKQRWRSKRPTGTDGGTDAGTPGTGSSKGDNPFPESSGVSRRDHPYVETDLRLCLECGLPESNRRHR